MLTDVEKQYYTYIGRFYSGAGEVVELGPWLGCSTFYILQGLLDNPRFNRSLYVFDDFTWRSAWMDKWIEDTPIQKPENHASFEHLFRAQMKSVGEHIVVERAKFSDYDGNEDVPSMAWELRAIEMCYVDCGRTLAVNDSWYRLLSPHFIPDKTLIIMQDWQNHKAIPERFWEQTKIFTDSKGRSLELIHEVRFSGIASFLFRGIE
jgi:hypothetical protein